MKEKNVRQNRFQTRKRMAHWSHGIWAKVERSEDMNECCLYYLWPNCIRVLSCRADSNLHVCLNVTFLLLFFTMQLGSYFSSLTKPSFETRAAGRRLMFSIIIFLVTFFPNFACCSTHILSESWSPEIENFYSHSKNVNPWNNESGYHSFLISYNHHHTGMSLILVLH